MLKSLCEILGKRQVKGDLGVEIEMEIDKAAPRVDGWTVTHDGSLGPGGVEYILTKPTPQGEVLDRLKGLREALQAEGIGVEFSIRTSVHVHVNVLGMTAPQLFSFMILAWTFESVLLELCGEDRIGNLFCLGKDHAEGSLFVAENVARSGFLYRFREYENKYSAVNLLSICDKGSLEFRAMHGTLNTQLLSRWINILMKLRTAALEVYKTPLDIAYEFSKGGIEHIAVSVFGKKQANNLLRLSEGKDLSSDFRDLQFLIYSCDWENQKWTYDG